MDKNKVKEMLNNNGYIFEEKDFGFIIQTQYGRKIMLSVFGGWEQYDKTEGIRCSVSDEDSQGYKYTSYKKSVNGILKYIQKYI